MRDSRHTRELRHLLQNKFALGKKTRNIIQIVLQRLVLLSTFCNNFSLHAATYFVARRVLFVDGKTLNVAIQLVLQQCCKTSSPFVAPFTVLFNI